MGWKTHFRGFKQRALSEPIKVAGLADIPDEATPEQYFCLTVHVLDVVERLASNDKSIYFLNVRDAGGVRFSIVCWDWQMTRFRGSMIKGATVAVSVRVPADGFQAFTLG